MFLNRVVFVLLLVFAVQLLIVDQCQSTPLDDYVNAPDPHFQWTQIAKYQQPHSTVYVLNLTSQKWFDETFSTQPIWWHYLTVTVPKTIKRPKGAFMFIGGGHNTDGLPLLSTEYVALTTLFAESSGSIGAVLFDIPNQPIRFFADPSNQLRSEDAAIAWTWKVFLQNTTNPSVLLQMPMTKAVVRAMDTIQQFADQLHVCKPAKFLISGYSKRGWATWTTAAVDTQRVFAAAPIVQSGLNFQANLHHHYRSLAGWSFALNDYVAVGLMDYFDSANLAKLCTEIDPYQFFNRYSNTKILQIQTTGDEFFLPDNQLLFWDALQNATGGSFLAFIPNTGHSYEGHRIRLFDTLKSFYLTNYDKQPLPSLRWTRTTNITHGTITATVDISVGPTPMKTTIYEARTISVTKRDFRQYMLVGNQIVQNPVLWFTSDYQTAIPTPTSIVYSVTFANPSSGWEGFYFEIDFPGPDGTSLPLSTEVQIIPDTYPVADCIGSQCPTTIV